MIHVGMDVHIRNSVLNAKDEDGQALARGRCGNTMLELSGFFAPLERRSKATGESIRVVMESTGNSRAINSFWQATKRMWSKWLGRRGQQRPVQWDRFVQVLQRYPLPPPRIVHRLPTRAASP